MKKQLLAILGAVTLSFGATAQEEQKGKLIPCSTFDAMEEGFKNNPALKASFEASQAQFEVQYAAELNATNANKASRTAAPVYTVPVVFHIMGALNIPDQAFADLITYINNDFAKTGPDVASINATFSSLYVDSEIRFALAKKDPTGKCTNGIIHHDNESIYWSQSAPNYAFSGTGTNRWPTNQYLNIYIVECIASSTYPCPPSGGAYIGGYTYLPGSTPYTTNGNMGDAIVMLRNQIPISSSSQTDSRTLSHEIGHWLNLLHTFGSSNSPKFDPSNMPTAPVTCSSDNVADTPPTGGYFSICNTSTLDCSTPPNIENIMDYASCPKMFTQGQVTRMRTALTSGTGGRSNLWSATNLAATGISGGYTCTPVADFYASKTGVCIGSSTTFYDNSEMGASGGTYSWTFQGGTPATSSATSQAVTYAVAGTYSVALTITSPTGSNTKTQVSYITVTNGTGGTVLPNAIDFQTTGLPAGINVVNKETATVTWAQHNSTGANSTTKSIYLNNFPSSSILGDIDYFETPFYDFSNTNNISLSYYYAYAKRVATQNDTFRIQYSLDCGGTWSNILGVSTTAQMAASLSTNSVMATAFTPSASQWTQKTIIPGLLTALVNKPSVKFRYYFRVDVSKTTANNMYIDQINLTGNVTTAITQLESSIGLAIYPNPTSSSAVVNFNMGDAKDAKITVVDMIGRVVEVSDKLNADNGNVNYTVNATDHLAKGIYIINIEMNNQSISKKLVIE